MVVYEVNWGTPEFDKDHAPGFVEHPLEPFVVGKLSTVNLPEPVPSVRSVPPG